MNTEQKMIKLNELLDKITEHKAQLAKLQDEIRTLFDTAPMVETVRAAPPPNAPAPAIERRRPPGLRCDIEFAPFDKAPRRAPRRERHDEVKQAFLANPGKRYSLETLARTMLHRDSISTLKRLGVLTQTGFLVQGKALSPNSNRTVDYWMLRDATAGASTFPGLPRSSTKTRARRVAAHTYATARDQVLELLSRKQPLTIKEMNLSYSSSTQHMIISQMLADNLVVFAPRAGSVLPVREYSLKT